MLHRLLGHAAAAIDRSVGAAMTGRSASSRQKSRTESLGHDERMLALQAIRAEYDRPEHYEAVDRFFLPPAVPTPRLAPVRAQKSASGPVRVLDATWVSGFVPHAEGVSSKYLQYPENRVAAARLLLHEVSHEVPARPAVMLIHGYRWGQYALEERLWPIQWLLDGGMDVVLPVLPFHGVRAGGGRPKFPSSDPRFTNEGFRQAIFDLRALTAFLRDRGAPAVGVMGMSLGGYAASLLATIETDLAFVVPVIPLASIADFARASGRFVGEAHERALQHEALDAVHRVVSPLARPPLIAADRVIVVAGAADRITPPDHAERLAAHFGAPIEGFPGGHLLQFGRAAAFKNVGRMLARIGMLGRPT